MQQLPPGFQLDQQPAPAPNRAPGIIQGRPKTPDPVTPVQAQNMENDAERLRIAQQGEQRQQTQFEQGNVSEQQAQFLLSRVGGGIDDLNFIMQNMQGGEGSPSAKDAVLYNTFGPNSIVTRGMVAEGRKAVEDVQLDILDSLLTLGTGAAYNAEQLQGQRAAYFPQFNDSDAVVALKRRRLERLFNDAVARAGPLGAQLEKYRGQFIQPSEPEPEKSTARDEAPLGVQTGFDTMGQDDPFDRIRYLQEQFGVDPGSETRLVGMINANNGNPNVSPDMVLRMYADAGVPPPAEQDLAQLVDDMRNGRFAPATAIDTSEAERRYLQGLDTALEQQGIDPDSAAQSALFGAARGLSFGLSDEFTGVTNAIVEGLQGKNPITAYQVNRDLTRRMADRSQEESPVSAYGSEIAGGLMTGGVGASGRVNSLSEAARVGAIQGGIAGFGYGEGAGGSLPLALQLVRLLARYSAPAFRLRETKFKTLWLRAARRLIRRKCSLLLTLASGAALRFAALTLTRISAISALRCSRQIKGARLSLRLIRTTLARLKRR
jgi:hypothetical protein